MLNPFKISEEEMFLSVDKELQFQPFVRLDQAVDTGMDMIYMLYYTGSHPSYRHIVSSAIENWCETPIFIGKTYNLGKFYREGERTFETCRKNISTVFDLNIEDFFVRSLEVQFPEAYEYVLIERYEPIWNCVGLDFSRHSLSGMPSDAKII